MDYALYASLAANALFAVGGLIFAAKLSDARMDRDEAREHLGDANVAINALRELNGSLLDELTAHRAKAEQVRQGALRASAASAAKRKNGAAAAPRAH